MRLSDLTASFRRNREDAENDLGLGLKLGTSGERLINKDGSFNIVRRGAWTWTPYQELVEMSWTRFFLLVLGFFIGVNVLFACGFQLIGLENLSGLSTQGVLLDFANAFFFSVQTFTTVGYGAISPQGICANLLAAFDALTGLMSAALATGLLFARFSKPKAQILFSKNMLMAPYRATQAYSLQFRIANLRNNKIINLRATVTLSWVVIVDGLPERRFRTLPLERDQVTLFPLNWTIVHIIDETSPVWGWEIQDYTRQQAEILILIEGYDETFAQNVHLSSSYTCREIRWKARFNGMYFSENGHTVLDLDRIDDFSFIEEEEE